MKRLSDPLDSIKALGTFEGAKRATYPECSPYAQFTLVAQSSTSAISCDDDDCAEFLLNECVDDMRRRRELFLVYWISVSVFDAFCLSTKCRIVIDTPRPDLVLPNE